MPRSGRWALWAGYIFLLPVHRLWSLPWLGTKLQPPELVFVGLAATSAVLWWQQRIRWRFAMADLAVAAWVVAHVVALFLSRGPHGKDAVIETIGAAYLAALYASIRMTATPDLLDRFGEWFGWSAAIAAALGIAGSVASWTAHGTPLATGATTPIPYLGQSPRAQAFTAGPQMLASILLMAVPLFVSARMERGWRRRDVACMVLLVLGLAATVSKTALCLVAALTVMWVSADRASGRTPPARHRGRVWMAAGVFLGVAAVFTIGSHVMVTRQDAVRTLSIAQLVAGQPLASFQWNHESWVLMPTTYTLNNHASLAAIARSWPVGVGPAGQPAFTTGLQSAGQFPWYVFLKTPHSTYLGTVAELGAAGAVALALLLGTAGSTIRRLLAGPVSGQWAAAAYAGVGAGFLIEASSTDLLNCRHYWLLLAVIVAQQQASQPRPEPVSHDSAGTHQLASGFRP
jgi:hypothetical protein